MERFYLGRRFHRAILASVFIWVGSLSANDFPFAEATIDGLQAKMAANELSAVSLTQAYLGRIAEMDRAGPKLRAVIELNPDALQQASALDAERKSGKVRGPLHGIPVLLKDNIATADAMQTTAGSLALVGAKVSRDATLVVRLREAGAVILGKTNLSEWANFRSSGSTSGWSGRGGQTHNPYALDRNPSGSSSGSAVAVSANLCVVAVGTETDGSIVSPASTCGIVGIKPTLGLVSRAGVIPISASQDTAGPMARTVRDAALLLSVLASPDPLDSATQSQPQDVTKELAAPLSVDALKGTRVGVLHGPFGFKANTEPVLEGAVDVLRKAGAEVIDLGTVERFNEATDPELEVLLYEFKDGLNRYLADLRETKIRTLADAIAFNEQNTSEELNLFGQDLFTKAEAKGPLTDKAYLDAREKCLRIVRTEVLDALMKEHRLDTIVALSSGPAWLTDPVNGDSYTGGSSSLAAVSGYPSVTVPAGDVRGLPVGLSFIGPAWSDAKQINLAADFERRAHARKEPKFLTTTNLETLP
jgi:amidase